MGGGQKTNRLFSFAGSTAQLIISRFHVSDVLSSYCSGVLLLRDWAQQYYGVRSGSRYLDIFYHQSGIKDGLVPQLLRTAEGLIYCILSGRL